MRDSTTDKTYVSELIHTKEESKSKTHTADQSNMHSKAIF